MMLHELVTTHRDAILARVYGGAPRASTTPPGEDFGAPLFLTQLCEQLRNANARVPAATSTIGRSAAVHGGQLLDSGFSVSQVVHHYGDICQAITAVATEQDVPITASEFHMLNGCLDTAIAEAVTACVRVTAEQQSRLASQRLAGEAQDLRKLLDTALLAFDSLKRTAVTLNGRAGSTLGRTLSGMRGIIDATVAETVLATGGRSRERVSVARFIDEVAVMANVQAAVHEIRLVVAPVDRTLAADLDATLIASAVANLLNNAFKFTRRGGRVDLKAYDDKGKLLIAVEDECGGMPVRDAHAFGKDTGRERRNRARSGLAQGLSIARQAVRAHGGEITTRNMPGRGCAFIITLPAQGDGHGSPADRA